MNFDPATSASRTATYPKPDGKGRVENSVNVQQNVRWPGDAGGNRRLTAELGIFFVFRSKRPLLSPSPRDGGRDCGKHNASDSQM